MRRVFLISLTVLASCGGDNLAESIVEQAVEQGSGEDIDIDIDDNGSFSVESKDGELSVEVDSDGNISMSGVGADGETVDVETDADGEIQAETANGDQLVAGTELPDDFPLPLPDGFTVEVSQRVQSGTTVTWIVGGTVERTYDTVASEMRDELATTGLTEEVSISQTGFEQLGYSGAYDVSATFYPESTDGSSTYVQLQVMESGS